MGEMASNFGDRMIRQVKAEPKRAAVLGMLVLVMAVLWGKAMLGGKAGPASASASASKSSAKAPAGASPQLSGAIRELQEWTSKETAAGPINRNIFAVRLEYFPQDGARVAAVSGSDGFWDQLEKSLASKSDQEKQRSILAQNIKDQAARLDLQSTMMSNGSPRAMIDGMLVGEGELVGGFRVLKIESQRIIVEREGVKLEVLFRLR